MAKTNGTAEDLFDDMFNEDDDLLGEIDEDDSEGWVPEKAGEGVQGVVVKVGETRSDFARDGEDPMVPTVTIETKTGEKYRIIGYGAVLKREMQDADPQVGDLFAIKYFGDKLVKKGKWAGKPYKHFGVAVRRAARPASA
jgi:hypothetical protein